jgi:hypothetical protein
LAPHGEDFARRRELEDAVRTVVGDVDVAVPVDGDVVEFDVGSAAGLERIGRPSSQELAVGDSTSRRCGPSVWSSTT